MIKTINIDLVKTNPNNPRFIKDNKYKKLVQSIKDFPQMLDIRPIVVDEDMIVLGGNMRLKACKEAGLIEVPIMIVSDLNEAQKKEFIIKDNQSFGDWDFEVLKEWDRGLLLNSGFEDWDITGIFGDNIINDALNTALNDALEDNVIDVNDYIKANIIFLNELMLDFIDDKVKETIRKIRTEGKVNEFQEELKKLILKYE